MYIEAVYCAYTACSEDSCELLHFARRGTNKDNICVDAVQTVIVVIDAGQFHIRRSLDGFFGSSADVSIT